MASLYVHIPFCERKCPYCDFYSVASAAPVDGFLTALAREIALRGERHAPATCETVFFGGGTPSLLAPRQLELILTRLHATFRIASHAEITLEANPGTVTRESLMAYRSLGVNRLSLGMQSFHDGELAFLGRIHGRSEALRCVEWSRAAAFENVSLDLIYAIPGQTLARWEESLRVAVSLTPQHVAAYGLTVAEGTPLAQLVRVGEVRTHPAHLAARMFERAMELLTAHGYEHYEVSNYALHGHRCRHNCAYWTHEDYLGFGPSAHSFWKEGRGKGGRRWRNIAHLPVYMDRLTRGFLPVGEEESVDARALVHERVLLGLRSGGLDLARLASDFGYDLEGRQGELLRWMIEEGMAARAGSALRLTSRGYVLCDEICARLCRDVGLQFTSPGGVQSPSH